MITIETQKKNIADWLNLGLTLTPKDAWKLWGCSKLSTRAGEAEREGLVPKLKRVRVLVKNKKTKRSTYVMSYQI